MTNNGLGWLRIRSITDGRRIKSLLFSSGISIATPIYNQPSIVPTTRSDDTIYAQAPSGFPIVGDLVEMQRPAVRQPIVELTGDLLRSPSAHAEAALADQE